MAAFRVAPVGSLRAFGTVWVTVLRNTPLTLLFFAVVLGLPRFGLVLPFKLFAILALGCYTSAFICEAVRSGINTVPVGQGEAARSLGMTFAQTLGDSRAPAGLPVRHPAHRLHADRARQELRDRRRLQRRRTARRLQDRSTRWATASSGPSSGSPSAICS